MFARIEEFYLGVLRLAVVAVAGLALIIAGGALVAGAVSWAQSAFSGAASVDGGDLSAFIAERRLETEVTPPPSGGAPAAPPAPVPQSPAIGHASRTLAAYLNRQRRGTVEEAVLVERLNLLRSAVEVGRLADYDKSLTRLADQLAASRGRPLTRERVEELIAWHHDRFQRAAQARLDNRFRAEADAWLWLVRSGQAFILLILIASYFLLVRVERHLRLVRVRREEPPVAASYQDAEGGA